MTFNFNWAPRKIPTQLMGPDVNEEMARQATMQDAAQSMAGYKPSVDINSQMAMQGYAPSDSSMKGGNAQPNLEGYGEGLQAASDAAAQAQAVEQQKAELQSQISALENRIAENTAKLQNWTGNANQIAAIEARKINSQDPTMIWRWKSQLDENRRLANGQGNGSNDVAKANAAYEIQNDLDSIIVDSKMDSATRNAHLSKLANLKTLAQKNGLPTDSIDKRIKEVKGEGGEQTSREKAKTDWKGLKGKPGLTSKDIQTALDNSNMNWDPDERKEAENLRDKLKKHEAAAQNVKDMKNWLSGQGLDYNQMEPDEQKSWQEVWKAQK